MKLPGPDHPITITPTQGRVVVKIGDEVIADTRCALTLNEASYPPVQYIPRRDTRMALLARSTHQSHCPYKGEAAYYTLRVGGTETENAVWSYEQPFPAMAEIAGYLAFYPNKVDSIEIET